MKVKCVEVSGIWCDRFHKGWYYSRVEKLPNGIVKIYTRGSDQCIRTRERTKGVFYSMYGESVFEAVNER